MKQKTIDNINEISNWFWKNDFMYFVNLSKFDYTLYFFRIQKSILKSNKEASGFISFKFNPIVKYRLTIEMDNEKTRLDEKTQIEFKRIDGLIGYLENNVRKNTIKEI